MTISSTTRIAGPFIGNGTASAFPFTFKVFAATDLDVIKLTVSTGTESTLVLTTDYTVSLNGDQNSNPGGTVTLTAGALASGFTLTITSDIANLQPTDLTNQGGFYPEVITDSFDRATIQIQQIADIGDRTLKIPISDGTLNMELPTKTERANSFLSFDANGLPSVVTAGSSGAPATITRQVFSGTGSQTAFTLASDPGALGNSAQVYIGGVYQQRSTYTIAGTTLTFSAAPVAGTDNIEFVNFLTSNIGATSADLVTYTPSGVGAVARSAASKFGEAVSVKDFGAVGNGVTDDTAAFAAWITRAKQIGNGVIPPGTYRVSQIVIDGANGLSIDWNGLVVGLTTGSYDAILTIKNSSDVTITGRPALSGQYNAGYTCAVAIYTDNATQATNINLCQFAITATRLAYRIGRASETDALVSEISIFGGFTYGCPSVVEAYGVNTFASFTGCNLMSNSLGGNAAWQALPQYTIRGFGANLFIVGGEVQHNQTTANATLCIEPITNVTYGNKWASIVVSDSAIESASRLGLAQNTLGVASPAAATGNLIIKGCRGYHSGNLFVFVDLGSGFTGKVMIGSGCDFYAGTARTFANVSAASACHIYVDDDAFGTNFVQGLQGITGGIAHFSQRQILSVNNTNNQALNAGSTMTTLLFQTVTATNDTLRFNSSYATGTGLFTVPTGGLRNVIVMGTLRVNTNPQIVIAVSINGSERFYAPPTVSGSGADNIVTITALLGDLSASTTVSIEAKDLSGAGNTCNYGQFERMTISAMN
jgi:hypothetical protein